MRLKLCIDNLFPLDIPLREFAETIKMSYHTLYGIRIHYNPKIDTIARLAKASSGCVAINYIPVDESSLGETFKAIRENKGLSATKLSEISLTDKATIRSIESGISKNGQPYLTNIATLYRLCDAMNIPLTICDCEVTEA